MSRMVGKLQGNDYVEESVFDGRYTPATDLFAITWDDAEASSHLVARFAIPNEWGQEQARRIAEESCIREVKVRADATLILAARTASEVIIEAKALWLDPHDSNSFKVFVRATLTDFAGPRPKPGGGAGA